MTAAQLAERTSTQQRYAIERLELMAVYGNLTVIDDGAGDRLQRRYALPPGAAEVLTDRHSLNYLGALPQMYAAVSPHLDKLLEAYRNGGGVSWAELGNNARDSQAALNRPRFESALAPALASVPEINAVLRRPDARIADIGCGAGWWTIALARGYPSAAVFGVDVDEPSIQAAKPMLKRLVSLIGFISPWQKERAWESLRRSMLLLLSSAFMTCHCLSRCWQRSAMPSLRTAWW